MTIADVGDAATAQIADERAYWAAFVEVTHVGPARIQRLLTTFGSLERAWQADAAALRHALDERSAESLIATRKKVDPLQRLERFERDGIQVLTAIDPGYPRLLRQIPAPPPVLFVRGELLPNDDCAVAIVGTRRSTSYGREVTARIATELAEAGVTIVSGLARGIDATAHQAALSAGGRTFGVLGCGVDVVYPPEHRGLAASIIESGALISDYPPGRKPDAPNFPARNRIISGLSLGVVVIEAPNRSGALITVDFAADQGRDVFVVPGSVLSENSAGCLRLLRDGARLIRSGADLLDDLGLSTSTSKPAVQQAFPMTDEERHLYNLVTGDPQHIDDLFLAAGVTAVEGLPLVTMLELKGAIRDTGAKHFVRQPS